MKLTSSLLPRRLAYGRLCGSLFEYFDRRSAAFKMGILSAISLAGFIAVLYVYVLSSLPIFDMRLRLGRRALNQPRRQHVILFWTKFYADDFVPSLRLYQEAESGIERCPYSNCLVTSDRSRYLDSAAIVFHIRDFYWADIPPHRLLQQYYLFYGLESPVHTIGDVDRLRDFFNLTFTYRLDSDVVTDSYFQHFHPSVLNDQQLDELLAKKTGFAVTFVSNCGLIPSRRDVYTKELGRHVQVDVYGKCGTKQCSTDTPEICDQFVTTYKFYLAFENSICKDYVTEKIHRAFNYGAVPVVYGGANYSAIFPKNSFINVLDFANPKAVADYLTFLDKNPSEYRRYFHWRMNPATSRLAGNLTADNLSWCKICQILNTRKPQRKTITDLGRWWRELGWCRTPKTQSDKWIKNPAIPHMEHMQSETTGYP
ncbi:alpha-(1,3)-fucosyltransferase C-like [Paramacrobiotus metropolitanus]|uniref:alpha-(1,3)-fucosyltransferase C-like n=1 Tax=Paramacrobiotus metropolitanus TaxID=2943436 RepID=UPI002445AE80|nr:alpha-(1,3)-fucosyltransferase C-like [Paramacrobiotus metropolitanus]